MVGSIHFGQMSQEDCEGRELRMLKRELVVIQGVSRVERGERKSWRALLNFEDKERQRQSAGMPLSDERARRSRGFSHHRPPLRSWRKYNM